MLSFYLKSAVKSIQRKKVFSLLSISGLAIGISVFMLTLEFYSYETGFNQFHQNLSNLYRVNTSGQKGKTASTVPNIAPMMQKGIPGVREAIRFADNFNSGAIISYNNGLGTTGRKSFQEDGCVFVDRSFLDAFSFPFLEGNNQLDKPNTVVITNSSAKKIFGDESAINKTIELHNQFGVLPCKVTGVIADLPLQSDIKFDYLFPIETLNNAGYIEGSNWAKLNNWGNSSFTTYVWLKEAVKPQAIAATASQLWVANDPDYKKEDGAIQLQPLSELHLGKGINDDNPAFGSSTTIYFILGLGILLLCIAWINYINFSTAYALSQAKDIGIHKIIGSNKRHIVFRYLAESLLLNVFGLLLAFLIVAVVQNLFNYATAKPLSLEYLKKTAPLLGGAAILVMGILLCGGYVGYTLSKFKPINAIHFNNKGNVGNALLRKGLVVFQFAVSIIFIASTIVAYWQINFMKGHDLGMNIENLIVINGPEIKDSTTKANSLVFKTELSQLPFVQKICATGSIPGSGFAHNFGLDGITKLNPDKGDENKNYFASEVDENYFNLYEIKFLDGRNFTSTEADKGFKAGKLIVNETAATTLGLQPSTALHQFVKWNDKQWELVGVVKDYHHRSLKEKIEPIIYLPFHSNSCYTIKMQYDRLPQKMNTIKSLYEKTYPGNPFSYQVLKDTYDLQYADEQRSGTIALSISVLVILIACLGLIGLSIFTAKRRSKEIGVRKILGASAASLFALLSKDFLQLVLIACFIATPISWLLMNKWLTDFAYRITIHWWVFVFAGATAAIIALLTVSFQAIKAAIANPVKSLRTE